MKDSSKGMGCGTVLSIMLTVAFVVLKLCKVIDWSWWWVVSPILIYIGIVIIAYVIIIFFTGK